MVLPIFIQMRTSLDADFQPADTANRNFLGRNHSRAYAVGKEDPMRKLPDAFYRHTYQHEGMWNSVVNVILPLLTALLVTISYLLAR